jgi:hypothetical protein
VKERPILFSGPMVRAILAGTKTQTRRVFPAALDAVDVRKDVIGEQPNACWWINRGDPTAMVLTSCPYGEPGDRLWVRETFDVRLWESERHYNDADGYSRCSSEWVEEGPDEPESTWYYADGERPSGDDGFRWNGKRPSIFMPRERSRLLLEVTGVRVECLQDITEEDARAEGVLSYGEKLVVEYGDSEGSGASLTWGRDRFRELWDDINGKRAGAGWAANPWVWCVSFRRVQP